MDHTQAWKRATRQRINSTAEWLPSEIIFRKWIEDEDSSTLWCYGNLGTGKTILTSSVIAHLFATRGPLDVISYFFSQTDSVASLKARNVLGSIALQLLDKYIDGTGDENLKALQISTQSLDAEGVVEFLANKLAEQGDRSCTKFLILDGLDEAENTELHIVSKALDKLCKSKRVKRLKVLCTGRPGIESRIFRWNKPAYRISLATEKANLDIQLFIQLTLEQKLEDEELKLSDPKMIFVIRDVLLKGARGMFLWAHLVIGEICAQDSDRQILKALDSIPRRLHKIFSRIIQRLVSRSNFRQAIKVLQFCSAAKRALTVEEIREALTLEPYQRSMQAQELSNDMNRILADCCGLVFVDEEEVTVHFIHHSVKKHLSTGDPNLDTKAFNTLDLNKTFGLLCMTYLNYGDFKRQIVKVPPKSGTIIDPIELCKSALPTQSGHGAKVALKLLRGRHSVQPRTARDVQRQLQETLGATEASRLKNELGSRQFHFLEYAKTYWIYHLSELDRSSYENCWSLFCGCVESVDIPAHRPWVLRSSTSLPQLACSDFARSWPTLGWALENKHKALLEYSQASGVPANTLHIRGRCVVYSASHGQLQLVQNLIESDKIDPNDLDEALQAAAENGHCEIVKTAEPSIGSKLLNPAERALHAAAKGGSLEVVDMLLAEAADLNAPDSYGCTPLHTSAACGHLDVVERLIVARADVNTANNDGKTVLIAAVGGGYLDVVQSLLVAGANVDVQALGKTALQVAAEHGRLEIVERLLVFGAEVDTLGLEGTALQLAAKRGHLYVVEVLLKRGADLKLTRGYLPPAFIWAAKYDPTDVVKRLLGAGADLDSIDGKRGRRALQWAARNGYTDVVEKLLVAGASDIYDRRSVRMTALDMAAVNGHMNVVETLLAANADGLYASGGHLESALYFARISSHWHVVERLRKAGAKEGRRKRGSVTRPQPQIQLPSTLPIAAR